MTAVTDFVSVLNMEESLRRRVLEPYTPQSRYVVRATMTQVGNGGSPREEDPTSWLRLDADCAIGDPVYIEPTGHFNAVEFNITYNQMLYLALAEAVQRRLLPDLAHWTLDDFFRAQLPDVLIADYQAKFHHPIRSGDYAGWFSILESTPIERSNMLLLRTAAGCSTPAGGHCEARCTIAIVNFKSS